MPVEPDAPTPSHAEVLPASPVCPFLVAADGAWRADTASADHRCHAVQPAAPLALPKQRRLCLVDEHRACATYRAARDVRSTTLGGLNDLSSPWGWVRTTPVVDTSIGLRAATAAFLADRRGWQVIPAVVLVAALGALGISNIGAGPGSAGPTPSPTLLALASPTTVGSPEPSATPTLMPATPAPSATEVASPVPTIAPTPAPTPVATPQPTPVPSASASYTVKSGDTLYGISRQFGVSVTALKSFNGLTSNTLHIGQVLLIP